MNKLIINQTLHGYDQGHSLLESSILIKSDAKRNLIIMSDMSGSSMQNGFEEYITGYPLKEINMYALAKTWNAPEMRRPGCVWTHTLLINFSDLIKLDNFSNLLQLFKRPYANFEITAYGQPIELIVEENYNRTISISNDNINPNFIKEIIFQLYRNCKSSILIQSQNPSSLQNIILSIWIQQWPRLKRNFSFCTGAISARSLDNRLLDLQVVPQKNDRNLNEGGDIVLLNPEANLNDRNDQWVDVLYNDLFIKSDKLRRFFSTYGADVREDRSVLISLVKFYIDLSENKKIEISEIIKLLSMYFPLPKEAMTLKNHVLYNNVINRTFNLPTYQEETILYELATTDKYNSFDFVSLEFADRFKLLFNHNRLSLFSILNQLIISNINPHGEIVLNPIAEEVNENDLEFLNKNYRKLLLIFLEFNPTIAYYKEFWLVDETKQKENLYALLKIKNVDWGRIISNLLELNVDIDKNISFYVDFNLMNFLLDWINNNNKPDLSNYWLNMLIESPQDILDWIKINSKFNIQFIHLIPTVINPNSKFIANSDSDIWLKIISNEILDFNYEDRIKFKAFILALALNKSDNNTIDLISYSFEDVYIAALNDHLDFNSWRFIEEHTRPLPFWKEWDKCKKLRNTLIEKFVEFKWPKDYMDRIFKNDEIFMKMATKYNKSKGKNE